MRAAGSGHSFTDIACTGGVMLDLRAAEPGARRRRRRRAGQGRGRDRHARAERDASGATGSRSRTSATSTSRRSRARSPPPPTGPASRFRNISSQIEAMELVLADGTLLECLERVRPRRAAAPRGSGSARSGSSPRSPCGPSPRSRSAGSTPRCRWTRRWSGSTTSPTAPTTSSSTSSPTPDRAAAPERAHRGAAEAATNPASRVRDGGRGRELGAWARIVAARPRAARRGSRALSRFVSRPARHAARKLDRSYRVFASQRRDPLHRDGVRDPAPPRRRGGPPGARGGRARRARRSASRSRSASSPATTRCSARPTSATPPTSRSTSTEGMAWEPYFRAVEAIMNDYGGRPHWGKRHFQTAGDARRALPALGGLPARPRAPRPRRAASRTSTPTGCSARSGPPWRRPPSLAPGDIDLPNVG